jgi:hypothetical protein
LCVGLIINIDVKAAKAPSSGSGATESPLPMDFSGYGIGSHWTPLPLQW